MKPAGLIYAGVPVDPGCRTAPGALPMAGMASLHKPKKPGLDVLAELPMDRSRPDFGCLLQEMGIHFVVILSP